MKMHPWRQRIGLLRSILIYYGNPLKLRRMRHFYAQFFRPGDLTFDIGAHVGNRLWVWSRLGANVVAVEPQPLCLALLQHWYGRSANIRLVGQAIGAVPGQQTLWVSEATPTVTTLSREWIAAVRQANSFAHVRWEGAVTVDVTTLDDLISRFGEPRFCKIDIEGYELEALQGLSQPLAALSFEYVPAAQASAQACIQRLLQLGKYEFNWSCGEQHRWQSADWLGADQMMEVLVRLQPGDPSGDVYARVL